MQQQYLVDEYSPPGGTCDVEKSPKPIIYLWGGGVTAPMILDLPTELVDSKAEAVVCGRTQRMAVTDDGKVISWKASHILFIAQNIRGKRILCDLYKKTPQIFSFLRYRPLSLKAIHCGVISSSFTPT